MCAAVGLLCSLKTCAVLASLQFQSDAVLASLQLQSVVILGVKYGLGCVMVRAKLGSKRPDSDWYCMTI
jgi:hypothetical protein